MTHPQWLIDRLTNGAPPPATAPADAIAQHLADHARAVTERGAPFRATRTVPIGQFRTVGGATVDVTLQIDMYHSAAAFMGITQCRGFGCTNALARYGSGEDSAIEPATAADAQRAITQALRSAQGHAVECRSLPRLGGRALS